MRKVRIAALFVLIVAGIVVAARSQAKQAPPPESAAASVQYAPGELVKTDQVAAQLKQAKNHPLILQVGFGVMYRAAHIPGAVYAGPAARPAGMEALKAAVKDVPKNREIILYCGCCPWDKCPNIAPAYRTLKQMGFTKIRVMEIPTDFAKDWKDRGFPVEKSGA